MWSSSRAATHRALAAALVLGIWGVGASAGAAGLVARLDPARSSLGGAPLSGRILLEGPAALPVPAPSAFDVVGLALRGAGLAIATDPDSASPGLGVLRPDASFEIPFLFTRVTPAGASPFDQTLVDVIGTFAPCPEGRCIETQFEVDTLGSGVVLVSLLAVVPEPTPPILLALVVASLAIGTLRRRNGPRTARLRRTRR